MYGAVSRCLAQTTARALADSTWLQLLGSARLAVVCDYAPVNRLSTLSPTVLSFYAGRPVQITSAFATTQQNVATLKPKALIGTWRAGEASHSDISSPVFHASNLQLQKLRAGWQLPSFALQQLYCHTKAENSSATSNRIFTIPNVLSFGRILTTPIICYLINQDQWLPAVCLLTASGVTDWLDGYIARYHGQGSVLGSYLDPLADKVLICSVVAILGYKGLLSPWLVPLFLGRDFAIMGATVLFRLQQANWRWPGWTGFLKTTDDDPPDSHQLNHLSKPHTANSGPSVGQATTQVVPPMSTMKPIMVSKINTALQLFLVGGCMTHGWMGWPSPDMLTLLEYTTAGTTIVSGAVYASMYYKRQLWVMG